MSLAATNQFVRGLIEAYVHMEQRRHAAAVLRPENARVKQLRFMLRSDDLTAEQLREMLTSIGKMQGLSGKHAAIIAIVQSALQLYFQEKDPKEFLADLRKHLNSLELKPDAEEVKQDIHWTVGFLVNFFNAGAYSEDVAFKQEVAKAVSSFLSSQVVRFAADQLGELRGRFGLAVSTDAVAVQQLEVERDNTSQILFDIQQAKSQHSKPGAPLSASVMQASVTGSVQVAQLMQNGDALQQARNAVLRAEQAESKMAALRQQLLEAQKSLDRMQQQPQSADGKDNQDELTQMQATKAQLEQELSVARDAHAQLQPLKQQMEKLQQERASLVAAAARKQEVADLLQQRLDVMKAETQAASKQLTSQLKVLSEENEQRGREAAAAKRESEAQQRATKAARQEVARSRKLAQKCWQFLDEDGELQLRHRERLVRLRCQQRQFVLALQFATTLVEQLVPQIFADEDEQDFQIPSHLSVAIAQFLELRKLLGQLPQGGDLYRVIFNDTAREEFLAQTADRDVRRTLMTFAAAKIPALELNFKQFRQAQEMHQALSRMGRVAQEGEAAKAYAQSFALKKACAALNEALLMILIDVSQQPTDTQLSFFALVEELGPFAVRNTAIIERKAKVFKPEPGTRLSIIAELASLATGATENLWEPLSLINKKPKPARRLAAGEVPEDEDSFGSDISSEHWSDEDEEADEEGTDHDPNAADFPPAPRSPTATALGHN